MSLAMKGNLWLVLLLVLPLGACMARSAAPIPTPAAEAEPPATHEGCVVKSETSAVGESALEAQVTCAAQKTASSRGGRGATGTVVTVAGLCIAPRDPAGKRWTR